ncbi:hemopexin [Nothobranchius furzeri]|uniref:Hemopexin n=1 Tax=Nothobranchius furzeri TaxID=105023 RepID=A0A9D2Y6Z8_NOTFU|nr:hemopexin [Nothobranchius furzeri]
MKLFLCFCLALSLALVLGNHHEQGNDEHGHGNDNHGSGNDNHGSGNDKHGSGNDNHGHGNDKLGSGNDNHGHGNDNHGHGNDNHGSGNDNHRSGNDNHGSGNDNHRSGNDNHGSGNDNHGSGNDKHGSGNDNHRSGNDKHGSGNDNHRHGNNNHGSGNDNHRHGNHHNNHHGLGEYFGRGDKSNFIVVRPDRCQGLEMDAATENEEGVPYFFKGHFLFKGFHGKPEVANETFPELDEYHHLGHVDAAFLMHYEDEPTHHDRIFLFLDNKVFAYYQHKLESGYPKNISEVFPGVPDHLDAAVECPSPQCAIDSVLFFKGKDVYHYIPQNKTVHKEDFTLNCTSTFRFMEHFYCFRGHKFSKFNPRTGEVNGKYPKEARGYFMKCSKFGADSDHLERERCSRVHLDAITSDDAGNIYAFRGHHYIREFENDTLTSGTIESAFKELHSDVDAVFSYNNHLYMIKDKQLYVYKVGEPHTLLAGYPKTVKEELGIEGPIDAAFVCQDDHIAHIVKGRDIYDVDLSVTPRVATNKRPIAVFKKVDSAMCGPDGVKVIVGSHFYKFASPMLFVASRAMPQPHKVSRDLFGCDH